MASLTKSTCPRCCSLLCCLLCTKVQHIFSTTCQPGHAPAPPTHQHHPPHNMQGMRMPVIPRVNTTHLLVQRVQHALARPVAVALMRQQHHSRWAAVAFQGIEEALRLQREGASVVVLLRARSSLFVCQRWGAPSFLATRPGRQSNRCRQTTSRGLQGRAADS